MINMKLFLAVTDNDWFDFLSKLPEIDEVNFWQPGGRGVFRSLNPGELFLFKLHSPYNHIAGGGFFVHSTILPVSLAWEAFGEKNGAGSYIEMRRLIEKHRKVSKPFEDYKIGCIILSQPFFFPRERWIPDPPGFSPNIVRGKTYDTDDEYGRDIWKKVSERLKIRRGFEEIAEKQPRYGKPILVKPRLGQGSFRVLVTDTYQRRCAVTREKTLPALEAAHIKPFSASGPHSVKNGILIRSDMHRLFDAGYITITRDYHVEVSRRIREDFDNGKYYFTFHGQRIALPRDPSLAPDPGYIEWHNNNIYKG